MSNKKCNSCGTDIPEDAHFCLKCGNKVMEQGNNNTEVIRNNLNQNIPKEEKKKKHIFSWIISVFMFLSTILTTPYSMANILMFLLGLIVCPPFFNYINSKYNNKLKTGVRVALCIILYLLIIFVIPVDSTIEDNNINEDYSNVSENIIVETAEEKAEREEKEKLQKEAEEKKAKEEAEKKAKEEAKSKKKEEKEFKESCKKYTFKEIARNPEKYVGKKMKFTGEVIQVSEGWFDSVDIRLNITKNEYGWYEDTIYCTYTYKEGEGKILEDDIVTIYGTCEGDYTYTSVMGASITLPKINIEYITIK